MSQAMVRFASELFKDPDGHLYNGIIVDDRDFASMNTMSACKQYSKGTYHSNKMSPSTRRHHVLYPIIIEGETCFELAIPNEEKIVKRDYHCELYDRYFGVQPQSMEVVTSAIHSSTINDVFETTHGVFTPVSEEPSIFGTTVMSRISTDVTTDLIDESDMSNADHKQSERYYSAITELKHKPSNNIVNALCEESIEKVPMSYNSKDLSNLTIGEDGIIRFAHEVVMPPIPAASEHDITESAKKVVPSSYNSRDLSKLTIGEDGIIRFAHEAVMAPIPKVMEHNVIQKFDDDAKIPSSNIVKDQGLEGADQTTFERLDQYDGSHVDGWKSEISQDVTEEPAIITTTKPRSLAELEEVRNVDHVAVSTHFQQSLCGPRASASQPAEKHVAVHGADESLQTQQSPKNLKATSWEHTDGSITNDAAEAPSHLKQLPDYFGIPGFLYDTSTRPRNGPDERVHFQKLLHNLRARAPRAHTSIFLDSDTAGTKSNVQDSDRCSTPEPALSKASNFGLLTGSNSPQASTFVEDTHRDSGKSLEEPNHSVLIQDIVMSLPSALVKVASVGFSKTYNGIRQPKHRKSNVEYPNCIVSSHPDFLFGLSISQNLKISIHGYPLDLRKLLQASKQFRLVARNVAKNYELMDTRSITSPAIFTVTSTQKTVIGRQPGDARDCDRELSLNIDNSTSCRGLDDPSKSRVHNGSTEMRLSSNVMKSVARINCIDRMAISSLNECSDTDAKTLDRTIKGRDMSSHALVLYQSPTKFWSHNDMPTMYEKRILAEMDTNLDNRIVPRKDSDMFSAIQSRTTSACSVQTAFWDPTSNGISADSADSTIKPNIEADSCQGSGSKHMLAGVKAKIAALEQNALLDPNAADSAELLVSRLRVRKQVQNIERKMSRLDELEENDYSMHTKDQVRRKVLDIEKRVANCDVPPTDSTTDKISVEIRSKTGSISSTTSSGSAERRPRSVQASSDTSLSDEGTDRSGKKHLALAFREYDHGQASNKSKDEDTHGISSVAHSTFKAYRIFSQQPKSDNLLDAARSASLSSLLETIIPKALGTPKPKSTIRRRPVLNYAAPTVSSQAKVKAKHIQLLGREHSQVVHSTKAPKIHNPRPLPPIPREAPKTYNPRPLPPIPRKAVPVHRPIPPLAKYAVAKVELESPVPQQPGAHWEAVIADWDGRRQEFFEQKVRIENGYADELLNKMETQAEALSFEALEPMTEQDGISDDDWTLMDDWTTR